MQVYLCTYNDLSFSRKSRKTVFGIRDCCKILFRLPKVVETPFWDQNDCNMQISVEVQMTVSKLYLFVLLKSLMIILKTLSCILLHTSLPQVVVARSRARLGLELG